MYSVLSVYSFKSVSFLHAGECKQGVCECDVGYHGRDCSQRHVENGLCNLKTGECKCDSVDNATAAYPVREMCLCCTTSVYSSILILCVNTRTSMIKTNVFFDVTAFQGQLWKGDDCASKTYLHDCHHHGTCAPSGGCQCDQAWMGDSCEVSACPYACHGTFCFL